MRRNQIKNFGYFVAVGLIVAIILGMAACSLSTSTVATDVSISTPATAASATTSTAAELYSIDITPTSQEANITIGYTRQFTATGNYSDGSSADLSSQVAWTSSDTAIATINADGLAAGVAAGHTIITANLSEITSKAVNLMVMKPLPLLSSLTITPVLPDNSSNLVIDSTQRFIATGTYSDGSTANISSVVTWTSSRTDIVTVNTSGLATGVAAGKAEITASRLGVTSPSVIITVVAAATSTTSGS